MKIFFSLKDELMKTNSTFSILFWINTSRSKDNLAELFTRVTINGKRVNISLKEKVFTDLWDKRKSKVRGNSLRAKYINHYMEVTRQQIFQSYVDLKTTGGILTAKAVKERFLKEDETYPTLKELIEFHNENTRHILHYDTQRHYKTSQKYILEYVIKQYKKEDIYLRDLNYGFIIGFENFLRSYTPKHPQPSIGNNTIMKHIQRLRKMVTMAFFGIRDFNPHSFFPNIQNPFFFFTYNFSSRYHELFYFKDKTQAINKIIIMLFIINNHIF